MTKYTGDAGLFLFSFIFPDRLLSPKTIRGGVLRQLQIYADKVTGDFEDTVATWNDPATFEREIRYAGGNPRFSIVTQSDKWRWLNFGTETRWALMHRNFRPKTKVGSFRSGGGHPPSEPVWRGRSMGTPQPGIEARNWSGLAREKYKEKLKKSLEDAIAKGLGIP